MNFWAACWTVFFQEIMEEDFEYFSDVFLMWDFFAYDFLNALDLDTFQSCFYTANFMIGVASIQQQLMFPRYFF